MARAGPRRVNGAIEVDAHGVRKLYVGHTNPHFQREILEAWQRFRKANPGAALEVLAGSLSSDWLEGQNI